MGNFRKLLRQVLGGIGFILLGIALIFIFQWARENLVASSAGSQAYPPPEGNEPTSVILSDTTPYPGPETQVSQNTIEPQSTLIPPPPPGWPTDQPWPRFGTIIPPTPTIPPLPFPTPKYLQATEDDHSNAVWEVWFPYYPKIDSVPTMWSVGFDNQGYHLGMVELPIDLNLPRPSSPYESGISLKNFHLSDNNNWLIADFDHRGSQLIELVSATQFDFDEFSPYPWQFFNWTWNSLGMLISSAGEFHSVELSALEPNHINIQAVESGFRTQALAYSPDGKKFAYAGVYPAIKGIRDDYLIEVGYQDTNSDLRQSLIQKKGGKGGGSYIVFHSLKWSPDGKTLIWIAHITDDNLNVENQLWIANLDSGESTILENLGEPATYSHQAVWSPDGSMIAVLKVEAVNGSKETANNIYLIDLESGETRQITKYSNRKLSHLQWTPDGKWVVFTTTMGDYGEIWLVSVNGETQIPIAGPTVPNAPFVIMP